MKKEKKKPIMKLLNYYNFRYIINRLVEIKTSFHFFLTHNY